jgi:TetR/AcrR family transcriptional repressor of nem operon
VARQNAVKLTAKGRATRERIVRAAVQLMNDHGVARTTILDVQGAAAVSPSQMYHYFSNKRDLVSAVVDHQSNAVLGSQELALAQVDSIAALSQWPTSPRFWEPTTVRSSPWPRRRRALAR